MITKDRIAAVVAGAVMAAAGAADAKPAKRHALPAARETQELRSEVQALKAEVQALEARLDAQAQAQQQTQAQAQTAQSTAQAAQAQVMADASKIETIPSQVETATKKAAPKPGWWNDTKIGATLFANASYIENKNALGKTGQSGVDYDIKRLYLRIDRRLNDTWSFNVTTDFTFDNNSSSPSGAASPTNNEAGGANTAAGVKTTQLFLKKAYLQAHFNDAFNVRLGAADTPWVPFMEGLYGYRYVENVFIDRVKFGGSSDWGVHIFGDLFGNVVGYQVSVVDGEGFRQPSLGAVNRTRTVDVEGRINATFKHFTVAVGGYDGKLGFDVQGVPTYHDARRFDALAAYADQKVRVGFEYLWARDWKDVTQSNPGKVNDTEGYSVFASYNFTPKFAIFGRYDWLKPKDTTAPTFHDEFFDVGLSYKPIPPLDFAMVYKRDDVVDGSITTADGVIGIPTGAKTGEGTYDEVGLFTQVKF